MRGKSRYTATHAVQQGPMKSTRRAKSFRRISDGLVHSSRTITRTICLTALVWRAYGTTIERLAAAFDSFSATKEEEATVRYRKRLTRCSIARQGISELLRKA